MRETRWFRLLAVALLAGLVLAACGGDDDGGDDGGDGAQEVPTAEYVQGLCSSMVDWQGQAQTLSTTLREEVLADPSMSMEDRKARMTTYLEDLKSETESFISNVEDAGVPDVEGGADVADTLLSGFRELIGVIEEAQTQIADLPTDDATTFQAQTDAIGNQLEGGFNSVADGFREMGGTPIDTAIQEEESCQQIQTTP